MTTRFDPSSWQKAAADWEIAASDIAAIAREVPGLGIVPCEAGSTTLLDDALAAIVPASAEAVAEVLGTIARAMTGEALSLYSTGTLYAQIEDLNEDDADALDELLAHTPWNG